MLFAFAQSLTSLPGIGMVFYPVVPKSLPRTALELQGHVTVAMDTCTTVGDEPTMDEDASDVDLDTHDFNSDGRLLHSGRRSWHGIAWRLISRCATLKPHTHAERISRTPRMPGMPAQQVHS